MSLREIDTHFWMRVNELAKNNLKQALYEVVVAPAKLFSVNGNQAKILITTQFQKDWWRRQSDLITTAALETYGDNLVYSTFTKEELSESELASLDTDKTGKTTNDSLLTDQSYPFASNLLKKYTFDNFVQGPQNLMTLAASQAITDAPGSMYNPLFIFSAPGLGKTHLLHAIGNEFIRKHPKEKVLYASSETFVNDYVNASRKRQMEQFTLKYRSLDLLLLDDVQFFSDKEGTKNEFFSTFNELYNRSAQIVITSDRPPSDLNNLEERLVSRFSWGLTTNITVPDFETRMAILLNKMEQTGINLPQETISYIASQINSNVRELEGAFNQVTFTAKILNVPTIDVTVAERALEALRASKVATRHSNLTLTRIKDETARYFHLPLTDLTGPKRQKEIAYARQIAMYLIRDLLGTSLPMIGKEFGNRDHTTVMYAVRQITDKLKNDSNTQIDIDNLKRKLES